MMRGDESAFALPAHENVLGRKLVDRFPDRSLAHAVTPGQFGLAWNRRARTPLPCAEALHEQRFDLTIERTESRRRDGHGGDFSTSAARRLSEILYKT